MFHSLYLVTQKWAYFIIDIGHINTVYTGNAALCEIQLITYIIMYVPCTHVYVLLVLIVTTFAWNQGIAALASFEFCSCNTLKKNCLINYSKKFNLRIGIDVFRIKITKFTI